MSKILAAALFSLALSVAALSTPARASGWTPDPHYGVYTGTTVLTDSTVNNNNDPPPTSVPEPATFALFGAGLAGCLIALERRRRSNQRSREPQGQ